MVELEAQVGSGAELAAQVADLLLQRRQGPRRALLARGQLLQTAEAAVLKRCPRFGHKAVDRQGEYTHPAPGATEGQNAGLQPVDQLDEFVQVFARFRGQADHHVEFEVEDAACDQPFGRIQQFGLVEPLVDQPAQPRRTAVCGDGHALQAGGGEQAQGLIGDPVGAQRGEGERAAVRGQEGGDLVHRLRRGHFHAQETDAVHPGRPCLQAAQDGLRRPQPRRPVNKAGRAEPAAATAAAAQLHHVHGEFGLRREQGRVGGHVHGRGHDPGDPLRQPGGRLDPGKHPVRAVDKAVERRHIATGQAGADPVQQAFAVEGRIIGEMRHQLRQYRFGLADDHQVGEGGQRFRVHEHRHPAQDHQRTGGGDPVGAVRGQRGNPARGQHRGQARVIVFEADRGKHQGEIGERPGGLERAQRAAVGRVDEPLADHLVQTVEQGVDQLVAEVGHRHRVGVGIEQGHGQPARPLLADRPLLFR